ncbi:hypothetical protein PG994_009871 [Apiospora phragmitis]|uniref:Uncharacterized protein n=1 Tax=Apiospora phragmitis TaxID=2905665 RepID=A0ABR1TQJ9_9PEZI
MSQRSPLRQFSIRPSYRHNDHRGEGPQHNGPQINNTDSNVQMWFERHRGQAMAALAVVAIVAIVSLSLGLSLGLKGGSNPPSSNEKAASPGSTGNNMATPTTAKELAQTAITPSVTKQADPYYCDLGCEGAFIEENGCHSNCPGPLAEAKKTAKTRTLV